MVDGSPRGLGGQRVAQVPAKEGPTQPPCSVEAGNMVDCSRWRVTHVIPTTGWQPGVYYLNLRHPGGKAKTVPVILRSPTHRGTVTVVSATSTHAAYNPYGSFNLYQGLGDGVSGFDYRSTRVSMMRPQAFEGHRTLKVQEYEVGLIQLLESLGLPLSYTTSYALHRGADQYRGASVLVFLGHDEYWSVEMRRAAERLRDSGTNLLFLGANTAYWRIRWDASGTVVTSYKDAALDPVQGAATTDLWRRGPEADPEASPGAQYPGLVGHEIDRLAPESPTGTAVVASSPLVVHCRWPSMAHGVQHSPDRAGRLSQLHLGQRHRVHRERGRYGQLRVAQSVGVQLDDVVRAPIVTGVCLSWSDE